MKRINKLKESVVLVYMNQMTSLPCGCTQNAVDLSAYGHNKEPFYKTDRRNCTRGHNTHMMTTDVCSCFIKYDTQAKRTKKGAVPIKMIMFACSKQCSIKLHLRMNYPKHWEYYQLLTLKPAYSLDEINEHMYDFVHGTISQH